MDVQAQWFPGHMAKTFKRLNEEIKLVDIVLEMTDARLPLSSRNPELSKYCRQKLHLLLLNKSDLADPAINRAWISYFERLNTPAFLYSSKGKGQMKLLENFIFAHATELTDKFTKRGLEKRALKVMVIGVPNVGKSTFINGLVGRKSALTADRPGVTRQTKWIINSEQKLAWLDTPGLLWPKIEQKEAQLLLALIGSIPETILDKENLSYRSFAYLWENYGKYLAQRYKLEEKTEFSPALFDQAVKNHGCLRAGGKLDYERFAKSFLNDFRSGTLGKISLERPEI